MITIIACLLPGYAQEYRVRKAKRAKQTRGNVAKNRGNLARYRSAVTGFFFRLPRNYLSMNSRGGTTAWREGGRGLDRLATPLGNPIPWRVSAPKGCDVAAPVKIESPDKDRRLVLVWISGSLWPLPLPRSALIDCEKCSR
jgi:hypothetical protein